MTPPPPDPAFDLIAYLHRHQGDIALMLAVATIITMSHWRHWFFADDLKLQDGSPDPRAGCIDSRKVIGDFCCVPTLVVLGILLLGFNLELAIAAAVVALGAFVGTAFIFTTIEKARDGALGIFMQFLAGWLPGKKPPVGGKE